MYGLSEINWITFGLPCYVRKSYSLQTHKKGFSGKVASPWRFEVNKIDCTSPKDILSEKPFRYFSSSARWTKLLSKITGISCIKTSSSWLSQLNDNETHVIFRVVPKAPKLQKCNPSRPKGSIMIIPYHIPKINCKLDKNLRIINFILHCSLGVLEGNYFAIF